VLAKLPFLDKWTAARQANARHYDVLLQDVEDVRRPAVVMTRHIFNQYVIRIRYRDALQKHLKERGIGTEVYYPVPMHMQDCFAYLGYNPGAFPESESAARETLALPVYPELTNEQACYVVDEIASSPSRASRSLHDALEAQQ
jgi:dTDP-4-amino-4,6-dideoxygalactose transaminase